jgi:hypothetical protein
LLLPGDKAKAKNKGKSNLNFFSKQEKHFPYIKNIKTVKHYSPLPLKTVPKKIIQFPSLAPAKEENKPLAPQRGFLFPGFHCYS